MRPGGEAVERRARQKKTRLGVRMAKKDTVWRSRRMERSEQPRGHVSGVAVCLQPSHLGLHAVFVGQDPPDLAL